MKTYTQRYTIVFEGKVFTTEWFEPGNNHCEGMTVIDNLHQQYTIDGVNWFDIETDHL